MKPEIPQPTDNEHHTKSDISKYTKMAQNSADDFSDLYTQIQLSLNAFPSKSLINADKYNASVLNEDCSCYCQCPKPKNTSHKLMSDIKERIYAVREKIKNVGNFKQEDIYIFQQGLQILFLSYL